MCFRNFGNFRTIAKTLVILFILTGCAAKAPRGSYQSSGPRYDSIHKILMRLGKISDPSKASSEWKLGFLRRKGVNALSQGDGKVYVTDGFAGIPEKFQEAILAHELGHDLAGHRKIKQAVGAIVEIAVAIAVGVPLALIGGGSAAGTLGQGAGRAARLSLLPAFSREHEREADRLAALILIKDKGNLDGVKNLGDHFAKRKCLAKKRGIKQGYFSTHPAHSERIEQLESILNGKLIPESSFVSKEYVASVINKEKGKLTIDRPKAEDCIPKPQQQVTDMSDPKKYPKTITGSGGAPMMLVPPGKFIMGDNDGGLGQTPRRNVYLDGFYIDKYPVTNKRFRATGMTPKEEWKSEKGPMQPVVSVTWHQANAYCENMDKRLPTEAEWEKAARGPDGRKYPWGNDWDPSKLIHSVGGSNRNGTHPVNRTYNTHQSPYGVVDMVGNVWEWVQDRMGPIQSTALTRNPRGPDVGKVRVIRGGSWLEFESGYFWAANRWAKESVTWADDKGFRCAKNAR